MLVLSSSRNDGDFVEKLHQLRHEFHGGELNPAFSCVRYYEDFAELYGSLKHGVRCDLKLVDSFEHHRRKLSCFVNSSRIYKSGAEQGVIPIENDRRLRLFRLLILSLPDAFIGKFAKKVLTHLVACFLDEGQVENLVTKPLQLVVHALPR